VSKLRISIAGGLVVAAVAVFRAQLQSQGEPQGENSALLRPDNTEQVVKLREVSALDRGRDRFQGGQLCVCRNAPFGEVKAYPEFVSGKPLFGWIPFDTKGHKPGSGRHSYSGMRYYFAVDESKGTGRGYDRLYFDANHDMDLRKDPVLKLWLMVAIGREVVNGSAIEARSRRVPVGDYSPTGLQIQFGQLRLDVLPNRYSDGRFRDPGQPPRIYGVHIRPDKPFVLDFSNQPEVLFAAPARDLRLKPGETLYVAALLVDPRLDVAMMGLYDQGARRRLDPTVVVSRLNGEKVAEGVMPFG